MRFMPLRRSNCLCFIIILLLVMCCIGELGDKGKGLFYCRPTKTWGMHLDDPRMDPLLAKCAELRMPVSIHVADPYWPWMPPITGS